MAIRALAIPEAIPDDPLAAFQTFFQMTGRTLELAVLALERVCRQLSVVEGFDLE